MKFDISNKFDLCYYGQVNSLQLQSSVASKWASKHLWGTIYFAGDGTLNAASFSLFFHRFSRQAVISRPLKVGHY